MYFKNLVENMNCTIQVNAKSETDDINAVKNVYFHFSALTFSL